VPGAKEVAIEFVEPGVVDGGHASDRTPGIAESPPRVG